MCVHGTPLAAARLEDRRELGGAAIDRLRQRVEPLVAALAPERVAHHDHVLANRLLDPKAPGLGLEGRGNTESVVGVEAGDALRGGLQVGRSQTIRLEEGERVGIRGQTAHHDDVLGCCAVRSGGEGLAHGPDAHAPFSPLERRDAQVDVGRQAPIQGDLAQAVLVAECAGPEVEEGELDGLAQLVDAGGRQEHVRDMRLHVLDGARGSRVVGMGLRVLERARQVVVEGLDPGHRRLPGGSGAGRLGQRRPRAGGAANRAPPAAAPVRVAQDGQLGLFYRRFRIAGGCSAASRR